MGITGLLPFLEKSSRKTNISEFSGGTVAIDTYCWLHKGAFSCAEKIIMGQDTDLYVKYCMKFVNMLLSHNIKPILVFDGRHLPAKAETESKRGQLRDANRKRAVDLIQMGKIYEGKNLLRRSLNVTHNMALEVIKQCQKSNVDCIVAPYEADAQLAYLNISGIADVVVTEDSDLTLFGCRKIIFKMDLYGHGVLVEQNQLHLAMGLTEANFHIDKFRYMCILSGCDYLASLPGIGLMKALKFITKNTDDNIYNALIRMPSSLNMKTITMTDEYREGFMRALVTFKHQLVYCPLRRMQVRLNEPTDNVTADQLVYAGTILKDSHLAWQLALGNCDPFTNERLHDFDPDRVQSRHTNAWNGKNGSKYTSIWSKNFKIKETKDTKGEKSCVNLKKEKPVLVKTSTTRGQVAVVTKSLKQEATPRKRNFQESEEAIEDIIKIYSQHELIPPKESEESEESTATEEKPSDCSPIKEIKSPILVRRSNPFIKLTDADVTSPSLLQRVRRRLPVKSRLKFTVIDDTAIPQSEFFLAKSNVDTREEESQNVNKSMVNHSTEEDCKENAISRNNKIISTANEAHDNEVLSYEQIFTNKDSGYKGFSDERENDDLIISSNNVSLGKQPLHTVNNSLDINIEDKAEFCNEIRNVKNDYCNISDEQEDMEFSISQESFSELKSSMFQHKSPKIHERLHRDDNLSRSISRSIQSSSNNLSRRSVKNNRKKNSTMQGQQSLLNMFGFQKKNSLKN